MSHPYVVFSWFWWYVVVKLHKSWRVPQSMPNLTRSLFTVDQVLGCGWAWMRLPKFLICSPRLSPSSMSSQRRGLNYCKCFPFQFLFVSWGSPRLTRPLLCSVPQSCWSWGVSFPGALAPGVVTFCLTVNFPPRLCCKGHERLLAGESGGWKPSAAHFCISKIPPKRLFAFSRENIPVKVWGHSTIKE